MHCIWCPKVTSPAEPIEHIIPEGLIGERSFEMDVNTSVRSVRLLLDHGEVCGQWNRLNGKLDGALQDYFGLFKVYWNSVGTKSGRPASAARPGMFAERRDDGPHITINAENRTIVNPHGVRVGPAKQKDRAVRFDYLKHLGGGMAEVGFSHSLLPTRKVSRALHKVAFELLCFQFGAPFVLDSRFDPIRDYVLHNRGSRRIAFGFMPPASGWEDPWFKMMPFPLEPVTWVAQLNLGVPYYVDLSPDNDVIRRVDSNQAAALYLLVYDDQHGILNPPVASGPHVPA